MQLPPPVAEQAPPAQTGEVNAAAPEQAPAAPESVGARPPVAPPPAASSATPQQDATGLADANTSSPAAATAPLAVDLPDAQDSDLIEKEWVHKAKAIVEQTKEDPYKQSEALTMFKADYMKKRYNKTIKLGQ